jgi:hypothetical protein
VRLEHVGVQNRRGRRSAGFTKTRSQSGAAHVSIALKPCAAANPARPMLPAMFSARQQYSPESLQGRVSTTAASLRVGAAALGQVAGGLLVPAVGTHQALLVVAAGLVVASCAGWLAGLTSTKEQTHVGQSLG